MKELNEDLGRQELEEQIESYIEDLQLILKRYRNGGRKTDAIVNLNGIGQDLANECESDYEYNKE